MKIAHFGDTHIRNLKYHDVYRQVFDNIYEVLREEQPDYIIHCGDIAHTKTQLSPEFFDLAGDFLRNLADIAPTHIILGNHDGNLKNSNRQDAITPIVDALGHSDLHLHKYSGEVSLKEGFSLNVLSVFDRENWVRPNPENKVNIALYHGSISGCKTDLGWRMNEGEDEVKIFTEHDYSMLGDIHRRQSLDNDGRVRYCGSTVQQNFGETNDKGFLIWDIEDEDTFSCRGITVPNPKPFITINLTPAGRMPKNLEVPEGARLRLIATSNVSIDKVRRATDVAKKRFNPISITFTSKATSSSPDAPPTSMVLEDLRDINIQERFIKQYLEDYTLTDKLLQRVLDLNRHYNKVAEQNEEVSRNVNWEIEEVKWDNLFNYGEDNVLNFSNLNGIVGVFGKNYSGKSSIIDSILYTIYNSTSKGERKNLNVINQNKDTGIGELTIRVGNNRYKIKRTSDKWTKKLRGKETVEAKTDVSFEMECFETGEQISLNGLTRADTDRRIRHKFGTIEDFQLTSLTSQHDALSFIKEGSTKRKEILSKFLDLQIFDQKFRTAKEDSAEVRGNLRRLEKINYEEKRNEALSGLRACEQKTRDKQDACQEITRQVGDLRVEVAGIAGKISAIPTNIIDIKTVVRDMSADQSQRASFMADIVKFKGQIENNAKVIAESEQFKQDCSYESLLSTKTDIDERRKGIQTLEQEQKEKETALRVKDKKSSLLSEVPCGSQFPNCKFICDAHKAKEEIPQIVTLIEALKTELLNSKGSLALLSPELVESRLRNYKKIEEEEAKLRMDNVKLQAEIDKNSAGIQLLDHSIQKNKDLVTEYEANKEKISEITQLNAELDKKNAEIKSFLAEYTACDNELKKLFLEVGTWQQKLDTTAQQQRDLKAAREEFSAYDLFLRCMHPNGIRYNITKEKLPFLNQEIAKILATIVDFEIFFENDDSKLNILIKHPGFESRSISMGSGAEKTIAAMAIRLALINITNLPKPNMFILDEPGTALDEENMEGFIRLLNISKSYFKTVLIISHLDSLKDIADTIIDIQRKGSYAYVNQ